MRSFSSSAQLSAALPLALAASALLAQSPAKPAPSPELPITSAPSPAPPVALVNRLPACTADQLRLSTDSEGDNFHGMSHAGTLLVLRNLGATPCRLLPMAQATLLDKAGKPLGPFSTTPPNARGMHPGPVVLPIAVAAGAEVTATLYWVSSPVFEDSLCLEPATLVLKLGDLSLRTSLDARLCGERAKGVSAELSRFKPDAVPVASPPSN